MNLRRIEILRQFRRLEQNKFLRNLSNDLKNRSIEIIESKTRSTNDRILNYELATRKKIQPEVISNTLADSFGTIESKESLLKRVNRIKSIDVSYKDFNLVESILPLITIPEPDYIDISDPSPSGWYSPCIKLFQDLPYRILRSRFHEHPIEFEDRKYIIKLRTTLTNIQGDIWRLQKDLKEYIDNRTQKDIYIRVDEPKMKIVLVGGLCREVSDFLKLKGF
ncbi:MAG: 54S ribosomal protein L49, mitochondrial [Marteilia pararefringens]